MSEVAGREGEVEGRTSGCMPEDLGEQEGVEGQRGCPDNLE